MPKVEILRNTIDYIESLEELLNCAGRGRPSPGGALINRTTIGGDKESGDTAAAQSADISSRHDTVRLLYYIYSSLFTINGTLYFTTKW